MPDREIAVSLDLPPIQAEGSRYYAEDYYEAKMEEVRAFVKERSVLATHIEDESHYKAAKRDRADLNKRAKAVGAFRRQVESYYLGRFIEQAKALEKLVADADAAFKEVIDEYEERKGIGRFKTDKTKTYTLTIETEDPDILEAVSRYAKRKGCRVKEAGGAAG